MNSEQSANNPSKERLSPLWVGAVLLLLLPILVLLVTGYSPWGSYGLTAAMRVVLAELGLQAHSPEHVILKLRLIRALCALGVGGILALAGAMTQGLFRNPLAEPGLLGISSGAMLGAVLGIAVLGGYGPQWAAWLGSTTFGRGENALSLGLVPVLAMIGALATALSIYRLAVREGRISLPALLLTGVAVNALLGSVVAAFQVLLVEQDWQVSRAIMAWGFGTLDDRGSFHLLVIFCGCVLALAAIPFVGLELDLLAGGEEDAAALGADPARVKTIVLLCVAFSTAAAVSICGSIAFVGLLVPQFMRMLIGNRHRALLPLSFLGGAALLLLILAFQDVFCSLLSNHLAAAGYLRLSRLAHRIVTLQPGVLTSLLGAPFFLFLLMRQRRRWQSW